MQREKTKMTIGLSESDNFQFIGKLNRTKNRYLEVDYGSYYRSRCLFNSDCIIISYSLWFPIRRVDNGRTYTILVFRERNKDNLYHHGSISLIQYNYEFYIQKQKRKVYHDTAFCNFSSMFLDNHTVKIIKTLICKGDYHVSQYSRNI